VYQAAILRRRLSAIQGLLQGIDNKIGAHMAAGSPANNPAGIDVNHKSHKHLTLPCRLIG